MRDIIHQHLAPLSNRLEVHAYLYIALVVCLLYLNAGGSCGSTASLTPVL
jgi:hypothetical protein